jgi:hypothetical protein
MILGTTEAEVQHAIDYLTAPDPNSRSRAADGARLVKVGQFAYHVPNWEHYRAIMNAADKREYNTAKKREYRAKAKTQVDRPQKSTKSTQAEAETESREQKQGRKTARAARSSPDTATPTKSKHTALTRERIRILAGKIRQLRQPSGGQNGGLVIRQQAVEELAAQYGTNAPHILAAYNATRARFLIADAKEESFTDQAFREAVFGAEQDAEAHRQADTTA